MRFTIVKQKPEYSDGFIILELQTLLTMVVLAISRTSIFAHPCRISIECLIVHTCEWTIVILTAQVTNGFIDTSARSIVAVVAYIGGFFGSSDYCHISSESVSFHTQGCYVTDDVIGGLFNLEDNWNDGSIKLFAMAEFGSSVSLEPALADTLSASSITDLRNAPEFTLSEKCPWLSAIVLFSVV